MSAANPESGTITYVYDSNGNVTSKTDARDIETTYTYDALNRVTARDYDDTTPNVEYTYKTTAPALGSLIKVESSVSTTEYTSFDILGRVTASKQTTDGVTYGNGTTDSLMTYTYNLSGALVEQQYPSGRVVKNVLDNNGDLETVKSKKNATSGPYHKEVRRPCLACNSAFFFFAQILINLHAKHTFTFDRTLFFIYSKASKK